jgi:hypothetical protein
MRIGKIWRILEPGEQNLLYYNVNAELNAGRVDPRAESGRVGSGWVPIFVSSGGSGRVGSRNFNTFVHVFRKLQNFARTEKL